MQENNLRQIPFLFAFAFVCVLLALYIVLIDFQSIKKKRSLLQLEVGIAMLLFFDALAYIYRGDTSTLGWWMTRISNCVVFLYVLLNLNSLNKVITYHFMETGKFTKLPVELLVSYIVCPIGCTFIMISQFTGMYYSFDAGNLYKRGTFFFYSYIFPFTMIAAQSYFLVKNRKLISVRLLFAFLLFEFLPVIGGVIQIFCYGISLINMCTWFCGVLLFGVVLADLNKRLSELAQTDEASGLPNAYGYLSRVDKVVNHGDITKYCGFYFDMVNTKRLNSRYGKKLTDDIICMYGAQIRKTLDDDEILGRLGGNYFVALVKKVNIQKFLDLLKSVPVEFEFDGARKTVNISAVVGAYEVNKKNIPAGRILTNATTAASYAKNEVHERYVFLDEKLERKLEEIRLIEESSRKAIKNGEFEPFYQPKVDARDRKLCGAEALVRWRKGNEIVTPDKFIAVMEKTGSICDLDFYMLEQVCLDLQGWIEAGLNPVPVSVNFSRKNLGNPTFAEDVIAYAEKYGIPGKLIQVEITETLDEYPMSTLIKVVETLQKHGMTTAIDDFGTGSSTINLLKEVRFDVLKIDKSFTDYKTETEKQLLLDIIRMAKNIGIGVIAEGVEKQEQMEGLRDMGCYEVQGYFFDKPLEKAEFEQRLRERDY